MTRWDDTVEFTQRIQQARDHEAICAQLLSITSRFGLSRLIAGTIPVPGNNRAEQAKNILFAGWPEAWMRRYLERDYAYVDPVLAKVSRNPGIAFTWREALACCERTPEATRMMCEARDHGLTEGFAVPMMTLEGDFATISFGGEHMDLPAHAAGIIHLVGVFAVGRAFHMQGYRPRRHESLTSRERDCLIWCGEGKTDWEISVILGVSETTVRSHLNAARRKLQACNKTQMVAEAIRAGVIR